MALIPKPKTLLSAGLLSISLVLAPSPQELLQPSHSASSSTPWVDREGHANGSIDVLSSRVEDEIRQLEEKWDEEVLQEEALHAEWEGVVEGEASPDEPTGGYAEIPEGERETVVAEAYEGAEEAMVATYYGEEFAGAPTTSGEPHDPSGYMAAHPYLPFGAELLVSYGGKSAVVRINDRCFCGLDLSWAAAQEIGITDAGTAVVEMEVLSPTTVFSITNP